MTNEQYLRYLTHRRREQRLNLVIGMSTVAFMFTMSLVPVMIIARDLWV
jgi:hypothetical protein